MDGSKMKALMRGVVVLCTAAWVLAFAMPSGAATTSGNDTCGYPTSSFTESTVMRWAQINGSGTGAKLVAYGNDEKGLLLGVNGATALSSAPSNGTNSHHASNASGGSLTATDPSGRVYYPALYITDQTTSANPTAGDLQSGGTPRNVKSGTPFVDDVFGAWSTANISNGSYTVTAPPAKNDWTLGSGSDAPVGTTFSAMGDEGYGTEVRWNVNELTDSTGQLLQPGDTYRFQVIEHDGDQNKTGGDAGEFCVTLKIPKPPTPTLVTNATSTTVGGSITDTATLSGGNNPAGTLTWNLYDWSDSNCKAAPIKTFTQAVTGDGNYTTAAFAPASAGVYRWIATYTSSDNNNSSTAGSCNDPNEESTVNPGKPTLATSASSGTVGGTIQDAAILSGGSNPTGTITWKLYGPSDASCSQAPIQTFGPTNVSGDNTYMSPTYTATQAGTYRWIASFTATDGNNLSTAGSCNDPNENSTVTPGTPNLTTDAVAGLVGQPIHDVAHLSGGSHPTGTIAWNVYAAADTGCTTPLNRSAISVTVNGDGDYTSPDYTPGSAGNYVWVASYSGDSNNVKLSTACNDPKEVSQVTNQPAPAITLHKLERIGAAGFTHGPITGNVGDTVDYQMNVTNTGNTTLVIAFTDSQCDSGTLSGPSVVSGTYDAATKTLSSGGELRYTCSHVLASGDQPYTNTANVTGTPPSGSPVSATDSVQASANQPGINVVKLQRDATKGESFTSSTITASVGDTIDYEIKVTNTGNVALTLSLDDPHCDAGTIQGPISLSGNLNGDVLSAGGMAQYTCSHVAQVGDIPQYTNEAVVTGQPPSGPPVHGTGIVVANITRAAIHVLKLEKDATAGGAFTTGPITVTERKGHYVVHTIDYEIQVTNTGSTTLRLSLDDPHCDASTIQGPTVVSGTLNGNVLSPGGKAQYTCLHDYVASDPASFTNTATVTGTPPSGPPVSGTSSVTAKRNTVQSRKQCRVPGTGRIIHYTGNRKPAACHRRPHPKPPKHPRGFTG